MVEEPREGCCFDDWATANAKRARKRRTVAGVTARLVAELESAGLQDLSILDVGCGVGDLAVEALRRGAAHATGIDLSEQGIEEARRLASEAGLADRAVFAVGDGARATLEPHDIVVLNRVFCCYPDVEGLVANSLAAARSVYAYTTPPSTGLAGRFARLGTALSNVWYRLRRSKFAGFRVFVHDVGAIDARVRAAGFRPVVAGRRRIAWHLAVYRKDGAG